MTSAQRVESLLRSGDCEKAVALMNEYTYSKKEVSYLETIVEECINTSMNEWVEEKASYEDVKVVLIAFINLKNSEISKLAREKLDYVKLENTCNIALKSAKKDYDDQHYIEAMVTLNGIDDSYSQYIIVDDLYDECKNILLNDVNSPITVSDYETSIELLGTYIEKVNDKDFVNLKKTLEFEVKEYKEVYEILTDATNLFEQKSYKNSFKTLSVGEEKYPDNKKIEYALSAYQYSYMLEIASQVVSLAEEEDYDSAVIVLEDAIDIYDCECFRDLLHETKMKTSLLYAAKSKMSEAGTYMFKSAKKMVLGDFTEDEQETLLSLGGSVAASIANVDVPLDVRDLAYDMTHWGEGDYFAARLALDAVGILPVIGALKYIKHLDTATDIAKTGEKAADAAGIMHDMAKRTDKVDDVRDAAKRAEGIIDSGKTIENISDAADVTTDVKKKADVVADLTEDYSGYAKKTNQAENVSKTLEKKFDDNGVKFRDGKKLFPNTEFDVNGYKYTTDSNGRVVSAEGTLRICDTDYPRNTENVREFDGQEYLDSDDISHLIGHRFGGSDKLGNLVPMDMHLNRGDFKKLENKLALAVQDGSDVKLKVEPVYKGESNRPTEFKVSYIIDGDKDITVFKN